MRQFNALEAVTLNLEGATISLRAGGRTVRSVLRKI